MPTSSVQLVPAALLLAILVLATPAAAVEWVDASEEAGIRFRHTGGGPQPTFPEMMGSGACWFDYDADGYDDVLVLNGKYHDDALQALHRPTSRLYHNEGDGTFTDATAGSGLGLVGFANGCSTADYDGDGCPDAYVAGYELNALFRGSCDGVFADVTAASGAVNDVCGDRPCWGHSSAWSDYDLDGDLDLYVGNYIRLIVADLRDLGPDMGPGQKNKLFRNNGDGTFTDVADAAGVAGIPDDFHSKTLAVGFQDFDLDGDPDLYVANDEVEQNFYRNNGDGTFTDVASELGVHWLRAGMGVAWGDIDRNGCPELAVTFYAYQYEGFAMNRCGGDLSDESDPAFRHGLDEHIPYVRWANVFWDYDNDGWLDYVVAAGHVQYLIPGTDQPMTVYRNLLGDPNRRETFHYATLDVGAAMRVERNVRGVAFGDYNLDGLLDFLAVANHNQTARLLKGADGGANHWIELQLRDAGSQNRQAIGSVVTVTADGVEQTRELVAGSGFESTNTLNLHFGLGASEEVDSVTVRWPDGGTETWNDLEADNVYRLTRGDAWAADDVVAPRTVASLDREPGPSGWHVNPVKITLTATDRGVKVASGIAFTSQRLDGGADERYAGPIEPGTGDHVLEYRSQDAALNREPLQRLRVRVDLDDPRSDSSLSEPPFRDGSYPDGTRVTLTATDVGSGVAEIRYRLSPSEAYRPYEGPFELPAGEHAVEHYAVDVAGREEAPRRLDVRVENRLPATTATLEGLAGDAGWWRGPVTVQLDAEDRGFGVLETRYVLDGGPEATYAGPFVVPGDGSHSLRFWSLSAAGDPGAARSATFHVDSIAPVSTDRFERREGNAPWLTRLVLAMEGTDAGSGLAALRHRIDGGPFLAAGPPAALPDGAHVVETGAVDVAGNEEPLRRLEYLLDATPPSTSATPEGPLGKNGWWSGNVTVRLNASDATSGVAATLVSLDGALPKPYAGPVEVIGEGRHFLRFTSTDVAGNGEPERGLAVPVDWTPPETRPVLEGTEGRGGWFTSPVRVRLLAADATSGVAETVAEASGSAVGTDFTLRDGVHFVRFRSEDVAGNVEALREVVVAADATPPISRLEVDRGAFHAAAGRLHVTGDTYLSVVAEDATSGIASVHYRVDDGPAVAFAAPFHLSGPDGPRIVEHWAVDVAGNEGPRVRVLVVLDDSAPHAALLRPAPGSASAGMRAVSASATDYEEAPAILVGDAIEFVASADDGGGAGVRSVRLLLDGELLAEASGDGEHSWVRYFPLAASGPRVLRLEAEDALGHVRVVERRVVLVVAFTSLVDRDLERLLGTAGVDDPGRGVEVARRGASGA